jgi:heterodisulfide reductase subunit A-like polyferredoxin
VDISFGSPRVLVSDYNIRGEEVALNPDLVVLSAGVVSNPDARELGPKLKVPLTSDGFFLEAHVKLRPVDFATDGIFLPGLPTTQDRYEPHEVRVPPAPSPSAKGNVV